MYLTNKENKMQYKARGSYNELHFTDEDDKVKYSANMSAGCVNNNGIIQNDLHKIPKYNELMADINYEVTSGPGMPGSWYATFADGYKIPVTEVKHGIFLG